MTTEEAERWIVNLIRNAKLDAKIDSKQGTVVMGVETNSPYQQLIEKTKALSFRYDSLKIEAKKEPSQFQCLHFRSQMLLTNIEKKKKAQDAPNWGAADF